MIRKEVFFWFPGGGGEWWWRRRVGRGGGVDGGFCKEGGIGEGGRGLGRWFFGG